MAKKKKPAAEAVPRPRKQRTVTARKGGRKVIVAKEKENGTADE